MHQSSLENMQFFFEKYVKAMPWKDRELISVVDIGGSNVNGSYSDIFSGPEFDYQAVDIEDNDTVDIVLNDPYNLPFNDESIDIIISGQAFEHVEFFWLLFLEMARSIKDDGIIILIAPSSGPIHNYPVDCYRFYPDAYRALSKYACLNLIDIKHDDRGPWKDLVGVFAKQSIETFTADSLTREWVPNRFEIDTRPATLISTLNPDVDIIKGSVSYLDTLKELHNSRSDDSLYLEIGVRSGNSLTLSKRESIAIDPDPSSDLKLSENHTLYSISSDYFFLKYAEKLLTKKKIDMAFIDGMHLFEFSLRDFINVEKYCTSDSLLIIDDVYPNHPIQAQRKRESNVWTGDVWKLALCLIENRRDLNLFFLDTKPTGLLVITGLNPKNNLLTEQYNPLVKKYKSIDIFDAAATQFLTRQNSVDPNYFLNQLF